MNQPTTRRAAHPAAIDAAQREIDRRAAEGEPMEHAWIDPVTTAIRFDDRVTHEHHVAASRRTA